MWQVQNPEVDLPAGFTVWEDAHSCQLRDGQGREVMIWQVTLNHPTAEEIADAARNFLDPQIG